MGKNIQHLEQKLAKDVAAVMARYEKAKAAKETLKAKAQEQAAQLRTDLKAKFMAQAEAQKAKTMASFQAGIAKKVKSALTKAYKNVAAQLESRTTVKSSAALGALKKAMKQILTEK